MIQFFEWKTRKNGILASIDMEEGMGVTLSRANPLVCVLVARLDPLPSPV
ncbi:putative 3,9-dihydroxypterocarpan 6A-monooxygenase [Helianthus annuus]|nr:putative 3,9-dihydroxypterocarpan 6A-monooxygenase [Helianthus annuus]KAJ0928340.1 putative 3,9-dihydroxypterocarpan 6A-monooxygenase [Helianthus annuus]